MDSRLQAIRKHIEQGVQISPSIAAAQMRQLPDLLTGSFCFLCTAAAAKLEVSQCSAACTECSAVLQAIL